MSHNLRSTPEALQKFCKYLDKSHRNRQFIPQVRNGLTRDDVKRFISYNIRHYNESYASETVYDYGSWDDSYYGSEYRRLIPSRQIYIDDLETLTDSYMQSIKCQDS
jgi:hypothetical protein